MVILVIVFSFGSVLALENDDKKRDQEFTKAVSNFHEKLEQTEMFVSIIGLNSLVKEISLLTDKNADPYTVSQLVKNVNYFNAVLGQYIELFIIFKQNGYACDYEMYDDLPLFAAKYEISDSNTEIINNCLTTHKAYNKLLLNNDDKVIYLSDYAECNILVSFIFNKGFFEDLFKELDCYNGVTAFSDNKPVWKNGKESGKNISKKIRICKLNINYYYSANYKLVLMLVLLMIIFGILTVFAVNVIANKLYEKIRFHIKRLALKANFDLPEDSVNLLTYVDMATENIGKMEKSLEKEIKQKYENLRQIYLKLLINNDYLEKYSFAWDNIEIEQIGYSTVIITENPLKENPSIISVQDNVYLCTSESTELETNGKLGISSTVKDLSSINKCFIQAVKAINYAFLMNVQKVKYPDLTDNECAGIEKYMHEFKEHVGVDNERTKEIIEKLFAALEDNAFDKKTIDVIREIDKYLDFGDKFLSLQNNTIYNVTLKELKNIIISNIDKIDIKSSAQKEKDKLFALIKDYIDENIFNSNLSLNLIGLKTGYSISQVSKIVSDNIGINFNDYINRRRIEKAKELLQNGYTVNKTVDICGFGSIATFRRLFKKYTGMTAQQFKVLGKDK